MHRCEQILALIRQTYPSAEFLEGYANAVKRFESKQVIIFRYVQNSSYRVIKYYGLDHLEPALRLKEKKAVMDEFMLAAAFKGHRGVINVYDHNVLLNNEQEVGAYYSMDYLETTLDKLLAKKYQFRNDEVLSFLRQMNDVLCHAHFKEGIIHSDIKPANIGVVKQNGVLVYKLMDFDVSVRIEKETSGGDDLNFTISDKITIRGMTPAYAAPEQVMAQIGQGTTITGKVDTYAVGVIAVQMLTGIPPKATQGGLFYQVPLQHLSAYWHAILSKMCHADIRNRPRRIVDILPVERQGKNDADGRIEPAPFINESNASRQQTVIVSLLILVGVVLVIVLANTQSNSSSTSTSPPIQVEPPRNIESTRQQYRNTYQTEEYIENKDYETKPVAIRMPDLRGKTLSQGRNILSSNGIRVERVIYQDSSPANKDRIINTRPASGAEMNPENASAILIVGKTP